MTQALEGEGEIYSPSSLLEVYKQKIRSNFKKFKYIYDQNWAFMKLKEKVHMYSQQIARIQ